MKTSQDPRHIKRQRTVQELFKIEFLQQPISDRAKLVLENKDFIDQQIQTAAPEYPIDKINRIDLAILRLAIYELLIEKKEPVNVIIDEAVELGKEFGGESSPGFINGALGTIVTHANTSENQQ